MARITVLFLAGFLLNSLNAASQLNLKPVPDSAATIRRLAILPQKFYIKQLPFTCKKEVQLQKAIALPLYIRLGSKEEVDRLEGKLRH
jgi:hypothetical protein